MSASVTQAYERVAAFSGSGTFHALVGNGEPVPADFTGEGELSAGVLVEYPPILTFTPPVEKYYISNTDRFYRRVPLWVGVTLLKLDGVYREFRDEVDPADIDVAERAYLGGHEYTLTVEEADELTAAGYGAHIVGDGYGEGFYGEDFYGVPGGEDG